MSIGVFPKLQFWENYQVWLFWIRKVMRQYEALNIPKSSVIIGKVSLLNQRRGL
jgi:hypothetical protein